MWFLAVTLACGVVPHRAGRDRSAARTTVGGELQTPALSIREVGCLIPPWSTFPQAPLRSRTVGFPQSGSALGLPSVAFPEARSFVLTHYPPCTLWFASPGRSIVPGPHVRVLLELPSAQSPFARPGVTARRGVSHVSGRYPPVIALRTHAPVLRPPAASVVSSGSRSVQVAVSPCWEEDLPDVILRILPASWPPTPAALRCHDPFLPHGHRPSPRWTGSALHKSVQRLRGRPFEAAVLRSCAGPQACSPPRSLLPLRASAVGSRGFSVRASRGLLPPHASDILPVQIGQLTVEDFHLIRCAALSAAPRTRRLSGLLQCTSVVTSPA